MFKRRAASNPPAHASYNDPSAASAAAQAFLGRRASNTSLSSAAAAAALRSQTTSPIDPGAIQTKRMARRASNASVGSAAGRVPLQRNPSSGSMVDRTFRSPTPSGRQPDSNVPPVPPLPIDIPGSKTHRRTASLDPIRRAFSPTPSSSGTRGPQSPVMQPRRPASALDQVPELDQENGHFFTDYTRPISPPPAARLTSTSIKPATHVVMKQQWNPNSRTVETVPVVVPVHEASSIQHSIQSAADQPVTKKKKKKAPGASEGSHLTSGGMSSRTTVGGPTDRPTSPVTRPLSPALSDSRFGTTSPSPSGTAASKKTKKVAPAAIQVHAEEAGRSESFSSTSTSTASPTSEQFKARTAGLLSKQPSVVREDQEGEKEEEDISNVANTSKQIERTPGKTSMQMPSAQVGQSAVSRPTAQISTPGQGPAKNRQTSLSPQRSLRFSATTSLDPNGLIKHEPLPRSVSPVKSALKRSPSPSVRATSPTPGAPGRRKVAMSDTSDTASFISDDGSKPKKKKAVRVSFDEPRPLVEPSHVANPAGAAARRQRVVSEDDTPEGMKPTPALPTFGSVRGKKERAAADESNGVRTRPKPTQEQRTNGLVPVASSGQATRATTSQDAYNKGTGETQPVDASSGKAPIESYIPFKPEERSTHDTKLSDGQFDSQDVPDIAVQPSTPTLKSEEQSGSGYLSLPGSRKPSNADLRATTGNAGDSQGRDKVEQTTSVTPTEVLRTTQNKPEPTALRPALPTTEDQTVSEASSDEDHESVYSDAEEDLSNLEGGFASLDAILEGPMAEHGKNEHAAAVMQRGKGLGWLPGTDAQGTPSAADKVGDWEQTRAYWASLSEKKRQQLEKEALSRMSEAEGVSQPVAAPIAAAEQPKPKKKKKLAAAAPVPTQDPIVASPSIPAATTSGHRRSASDKPSATKTVRGGEPASASPEVHMRQSMRGAGKMPTSMRHSGTSEQGSAGAQPRTRAAPQQSSRPLSTSNLPMPSSNTSPPAPVLTPKIRAKSALRRNLSNDSSASDSSFRRQRRTSKASNATEGKYAMRRSMRDGPPGLSAASTEVKRPSSAMATKRGSSPPVNKSGRFSLRSLSPPASFTRKGMSPAGRASIDTSVPTLRNRGGKGPQPVSGFSSFGRPKGRAAPPKTKPKSRFDDSSDDDEEVPTFQSRFADSDDDEPLPASSMPADLTPVRGIPRKPGQESGDSTELSDSEVEQRPKASDKPSAPATAPKKSGEPVKDSPQGTALQAGSLRDQDKSKPAELPNGIGVGEKTPTKSKRRFFGLMKRKEEAPPRDRASLDMPAVRPSSPRPPVPPLARRNTERMTSSSPQRTPKLQRRTTPQSFTPTTATASRFDKSALPPVPPIPSSYTAARPAAAATVINGGNNVRPPNRDGSSAAAAAMPKTMRGSKKERPRPKAKRRFSADEEPPMGLNNAVYSQRTGKKKKFPGLRRMFGLTD